MIILSTLLRNEEKQEEEAFPSLSSTFFLSRICTEFSRTDEDRTGGGGESRDEGQEEEGKGEGIIGEWIYFLGALFRNEGRGSEEEEEEGNK